MTAARPEQGLQEEVSAGNAESRGIYFSWRGKFSV